MPLNNKVLKIFKFYRLVLSKMHIHCKKCKIMMIHLMVSPPYLKKRGKGCTWSLCAPNSN